MHHYKTRSLYDEFMYVINSWTLKELYFEYKRFICMMQKVMMNFFLFEFDLFKSNIDPNSSIYIKSILNG